MDTTTPEPVVFTDLEKVLHSLRQLQLESGRTLTLHREASDDAPPIEMAINGVELDIENNDVGLELAQIADPDTEFRAAPLSLSAGGGADLLCFSPMHFKAIDQAGERAMVYCTLPQTVCVTEYRQDVRMSLTKGMWARVAIRQFEDQPAAEGHLVDLSVSGCQACLPMRAGVLLRIEDPPAELQIAFPNGEDLAIGARARHIRVDSTGDLTYVGFVFNDSDTGNRQQLGQWLRSIEQEKAVRSGHRHAFMQPQPLFQSSGESSFEPIALPTHMQRRTTQPLSPVLRSLAITVVAMRNARKLPVDHLRASADLIIESLDSDRQAFLYALRCLRQQPELFRHSISAAGWLADLIADCDEWHHARSDIVIALLLHDLGKTHWIDAERHTLEHLVDLDERDAITEHASRLVEQLADEDIFEDEIGPALIHELSSMPEETGRPVAQLSSLAAAGRTVHRLDRALAGKTSSVSALPTHAYKALYSQPDHFDPAWLKRFIQRQGLYPIGSLAYFSRGFLAWIMRLDDNGDPARLRVVKNLAYKHRNMRDVLEPADFSQLGRFEKLVDPSAYNLHPF